MSKPEEIKPIGQGQGPPPELVRQYEEAQRKNKNRKHIPDENFERLKQELVVIRAKAVAVLKNKGKVSDVDREQILAEHETLAITRPTLFYHAISPDKDLTLAMEMIDILIARQSSGNRSLKKASKEMWNHLSDRLAFPEAKTWIKQ